MTAVSPSSFSTCDGGTRATLGGVVRIKSSPLVCGIFNGLLDVLGVVLRGIATTRSDAQRHHPLLNPTHLAVALGGRMLERRLLVLTALASDLCQESNETPQCNFLTK